MTISSATRVLQALNHQEPEHVPFDLGGTRVTTIYVTAYQNLRRYLAVLAEECHPCRDQLVLLKNPEESFIRSGGLSNGCAFSASTGTRSISTMCALTKALDRESRASQYEGPSHRRLGSSSLAPCWVVCITITSGARLRNHHVPAQPNG
jgi:hypothetical protein